MTTDNKQVTDSTPDGKPAINGIFLRVTNAGNPSHIPGWALGYAKAGLRVAPTYLDKKHPAVMGWSDDESDCDPAPSLARPYDKELKRYRDRGICVVTGQRPGHAALWVLDIDPGAGGNAWLARVEEAHGPLPTDAMVHTPSGGRHYYWAIPEGSVCPRTSAGQVAPGVDVRGQRGGQVSAPGTTRAAGAYRWHRDDLVRGEGIVIPYAPDWLLAEAHAACPLPAERPRATPTATPGWSPVSDAASGEMTGRLLRWARPMLERLAAAQAGTRNRELNACAYSAASACAGEAVSAQVRETLRAALLAAADACGLDSEEAERTLESGWAAGEGDPSTLPAQAEVVEGGWRDDVPPAEEEVAAKRPARSGTTPPPVGGDEEAPPVGRRHKPIIVASGLVDDQAEVVAALDKILLAHPDLYGRGGRVVRVDAEVGISAVSKGDIVRLLTDAALWVKRLPPAKGETECRYLPLDAMPEQIVTLALSSAARLRQLDAVRTCPYYAPSGRLVVEQGYDAETRTVLRHTLRIDTGLSVSEARGRLDRWCADFPYATPTDRAHMIALAVLTMVRPMVREAPLFLLSAPTSGTGKSKLAKAVATVVLGEDPAEVTWPREAEEQGKTVDTALKSGDAMILLDNVDTQFGGGKLESTLTAERVRVRGMATQDWLRMENRAVWVATANNARITGDMPRRLCPVRLDAGMERPTERVFSYDPVAWSRDHREYLLSALCSLVQRWDEAGRPRGKAANIADFQVFRAIVGGIVELAGYATVLPPGTVAAASESMDMETADWRSVCALWLQRHGPDTLVTVDDILRIAQPEGLLLGALAMGRGGSGPDQMRARMGRYLAAKVDTMHGPYRICTRRITAGQRYSLRDTRPAPTPPAPAPAPTGDIVRPTTDGTHDRAQVAALGATVPAAAQETACHAPQAAPPASPAAEAPSSAGEAPVPSAVHPDAVLRSAGLRLDPLPPIPTQGGEIKGMRLAPLPPLTPAIRSAVEAPVWRSEEQVALPWDGPGPVDEGATHPASDPWASPGRSSARAGR